MTVFTIPAPADWLAGITTWSSPLFTEFLPIIYVPLGLTVSAFILLFLVRSVTDAFGYLFGIFKKRDDI